MSTKIKFSIIILLLTSVIYLGQAQKSRAYYEKEKKALLKKISQTNKILNQTKHKKQASQGQLNALNEQVRVQSHYISSLSSEMGLIKHGLKDSKNKIDGLSNKIVDLKSDYANTVNQTYKTKKSFNTLTYIFTSSSFNQMMMRLNFLKQYRKARVLQVSKINREKNKLQDKRIALTKKERDKRIALLNLKNEKGNLDKLKTKQANVLKELAAKEGDIQKQLNKYRAEQRKLEAHIKKAIESEIAKTKKPTTSKTTLKQREQDVALAKEFIANKGRLPWPVSKAFVSRRFGRQPHPVLKDVFTDNMGIGLQTEKEAAVRSVFNGKVTTVVKIPGMNYVVMVKHGTYFTVYARLKKVYVTAGQEINVKDAIGLVSTDPGGKSEMEFQVWKGSVKQNPIYWLHK